MLLFSIKINIVYKDISSSLPLFTGCFRCLRCFTQNVYDLCTRCFLDVYPHRFMICLPTYAPSLLVRTTSISCSASLCYPSIVIPSWLLLSRLDQSDSADGFASSSWQVYENPAFFHSHAIFELYFRCEVTTFSWYGKAIQASALFVLAKKSDLSVRSALPKLRKSPSNCPVNKI